MQPDPPATPSPRRRAPRWIWLAAGLVALAAGSLPFLDRFSPADANAKDTPGAARPVAAGASAPPRSEQLLPRFQGAALGGGVAGSDTIGHRRALIWVFSTRDPHRDAHARMLENLAAEATRANIALLGVARDADPSGVPLLIQKHGFEFPVVLDPSGAIYRKLRLPPGDSALIAVDAEGYIIGGFVGLQGEAENLEELYENELRRALLLEKPGRPATIAFGLKPAAPPFRVQTLSGEPLSSDSLQGKVIALVFFLPTCPHCHDALKFLQQLEGELANPDFRIVPVSIREGRAAIDSMLKEHSLRLAMYVDPGRVSQQAYGHNGSVPDVIIIDRKGTVMARHQGTDPRVQSLIKMEVRRALGIENPLLLAKTGYSGEQACSICHEQAHETWSLTRHSFAFETLIEHGEDRNPECVSCHVVGWQKPGGYSLEAPAPHLEGVQCESCHGRGGPHQSPEFAKQGLQGVCAECHNPKHSLNFVFAERLPLVSHAANSELTSLSLDERRRLLSERNARKRSLFQSGDYVGSARCQSCHEPQYKLWAESGHAHAFETLRVKGEHEKADCLSCHVTGYEKQGGYPEGGSALTNVGCESCHGPGGRHVADGAVRKGTILGLADKCDSCVVLQICGSCHTEEWSPNFEFDLEQHIERLRHGLQPVAELAEP